MPRIYECTFVSESTHVNKIFVFIIQIKLALYMIKIVLHSFSFILNCFIDFNDINIIFNNTCIQVSLPRMWSY